MKNISNIIYMNICYYQTKFRISRFNDKWILLPNWKLKWNNLTTFVLFFYILEQEIDLTEVA
jgi:hypothetical protein